MIADKPPETNPAPARSLLQVSKEEMRLVARSARAGELDPAHGTSPGARFGHGFGLPFAIVRRLWADDTARRFYLRVKLRQLAAVVFLTVAVALLVSAADGFDGDHGGLHVHTRKGLAALLSSLYALVAGVEWCVIAISRQYDDQIARAAALLTGTPPEDPDLRPEIHIDVPWMWRKAKRRLRGMRVFVSGLPLIALALLVPYVGRWMNAALTFAWGAYWATVFTAAKSSTAWKDEGSAPDPWFLRWLVHLTDDVPVFRWWGPRLYLRTWRRLTVALASPCLCVERTGYELLGLVCLRALVGLPGGYLFLRPLVVVAATRINLAGRRAELTATISGASGTPSPEG